jgi:hypothetical protein
MPHLSPTHHETSKCVSPHKTDSRVRQLKSSGFKFKPWQVNYSSQFKPRYWPIGFSINGKKNDKQKKKAKKSSNSKLPPEINSPNTLNVSSTPYVEFIIFFLSITRLAKKFYQLCTHSLPLAMNLSNTNWEKHEMLCMRSKLGCFTYYINKYFSNYTQQDAKTLQKWKLILTNRPLVDNKHVAMS